MRLSTAVGAAVGPTITSNSRSSFPPTTRHLEDGADDDDDDDNNDEKDEKLKHQLSINHSTKLAHQTHKWSLAYTLFSRWWR